MDFKSEFIVLLKMRISVKHLSADVEVHGEHLVLVVLQIGGQSVLVDPDLLGLSHAVNVLWEH